MTPLIILGIAVLILAIIFAFGLEKVKKENEEVCIKFAKYKSNSSSSITDLNHSLSQLVNRLRDMDIKIANLESKNRALKEAFDKLQFEVKNPPKYKVGDKAPQKGWVVTKAEVVERDITDSFLEFYPRVSKRLFDSNGLSIGGVIENIKYKNQYTATNIKTGEVKTWAE